MFSKKILAVSVSAVTLAMVGCGAGSQDSGASGNSVQLSGLVVDPYVAQAKVYVDLNNNGVHEYGNFEPFAYTDEDGYFSADKDGNSYCDKDLSTYDKRHCLDTRQVSDNAVIRIEGGFDVATGEKFKGSLSLPVTLDGSGGKSNTGVANPLTALFASVSETDRDAILEFIDSSFNGSTATDAERDALVETLTNDFMDSSDPDQFSAERFKKAISVHKSVAILSRALEKRYDWIKPNSKVGSDKTLMPASAGKFVYEGLVAELVAGTDMTTAAGWESVLNSADTALRTRYTSAGGSGLPAALSGTTTATELGERVSALYSWFSTLSVSTLSVTSGDTEDQKAEAKKALERVARLADISVGIMEKEISDSGEVAAGSSNVETLLSPTLKSNAESAMTKEAKSDTDPFASKLGDDADISAAISSAVTDLSSVSALPQNGRFFGGADANIFLNEKLRLTDYESDTERQAIEVYFKGNSGDLSGDFVACIHIATASTDKTDLEDIADEGALIKGRWSRLTDYTLNISVTEPVSLDNSLIVKATQSFIASTGAGQLQFTTDDNADPEAWNVGSLSTDGNYGATATLPSSDSECAITLPSS